MHSSTVVQVHRYDIREGISGRLDRLIDSLPVGLEAAIDAGGWRRVGSGWAGGGATFPLEHYITDDHSVFSMWSSAILFAAL